MHATTFDSVNSVGLPAMVCEAPAKQSNTEADLVARLKGGDQMAFRELVERYQSKIRHVTFGILGSREDTDEIAQEVFAKVYFALVITENSGRPPEPRFDPIDARRGRRVNRLSACQGGLTGIEDESLPDGSLPRKAQPWLRESVFGAGKLGNRRS